MDSNLVVFIAIALAIFLGLIGIALTILFGLGALRRDLLSDLSVIKEKVIGIEQTVKNLWDVFFGGRLPTIYISIPNRIRLEVPSAEQKICTEYISLFLRWLDSTYFESFQKIKDYEEPIQV